MKKIIIFSIIICLSLFTAKPVKAIGSDINGDNKVDILDYNILLSNFGKTGAIGWIPSDIIKNGKVDVFDYNSLVTNFMKPTSTPSPILTDPNHINVGAIYFCGSTMQQRNEIEGLIAFDKYKYIWPYFTVIRSTTTPITIDVHEADQRIMDQEINLAATAGLDYFAFLNLYSSNIVNYGIDNYLRSPNKNKIKFSIIYAGGQLLDNNRYSELISYLQDPQYLRVTSSQRPLIYVFQPSATANFQTLLTKIQNDIGKKPILVPIEGGPAAANMKTNGFEAIGDYLPQHTIDPESMTQAYSQFAAGVQKIWDQQLKIYSPFNIDVIPTASLGHDTRPKSLNPLYHPGVGTDPQWVTQGTPTEFANHILSAVNWVKAHPANSRTKTVLIYAWNEFAEGGWLTPSLTDNNARLNAISKVLGGRTQNTPISPFIANPPSPHPIGSITVTNPRPNSAFSGNVVGTAPNAARITIQCNSGHKTFFINGKFGNRESQGFSIPIPYCSGTLKLTSPDTTSTQVVNINP